MRGANSNNFFGVGRGRNCKTAIQVLGDAPEELTGSQGRGLIAAQRPAERPAATWR